MTPYTGKRARRDVLAQAATSVVEQPSAYVGRRALRVEVPETPAESLIIPAPTPELVPAAPAATAFQMPTPRTSVEWELFAAESPEDTGALPYALTEDFTGSLPKITDEMFYGVPGTDLSQDTTTSMPAIRVGKRRAATRTRTPLLRGLSSLPSLVGVAVLAVAGIGAVTSGHSDLIKVDAGPLRAASALSGTSGVAVVGSAREAVLSRSTNRDANATAQKRAAALADLAKKAQSKSDQLKANQWVTPIAPGVYHLTARFGDCGLWAACHTGLDFAAPTGTPIRAVANGTITSTQWDGAYGNKTVETLDDGTELWYAHQVRFGSTPGQVVHAGEIIGYVGATGHVTGPHVHLEVRPGGGDPVDPFTALVAQGVQP
ncbi:M23 family metallopeptidase [Nocardioides sp. Kera G14]|uniref:M23 family metallopeptidase n=1 Tax=Nocardioides sp. Kera G14 TaxID=2884264 RepID=UPI001D1282AE|nr:M23 family metallopeptidase [Nocardioides sp. Kera G14]UDY24369.1 M23 family metallopeptidase [Nocardioides sp. Kera G14]